MILCAPVPPRSIDTTPRMSYATSRVTLAFVAPAQASAVNTALNTSGVLTLASASGQGVPGTL